MNPMPKPKTHRCKDYVDRWIRDQKCVLCGTYATAYTDVVPMHKITKDGGGKGQKGPDKDALPGCFYCHDIEHKIPKTFWGWVERKTRKSREQHATEHWGRYLEETK